MRGNSGKSGREKSVIFNHKCVCVRQKERKKELIYLFLKLKMPFDVFQAVTQ